MKTTRGRVWLLIIPLFATMLACAQPAKRFTGTFSHLRFEVFAQQVEQVSTYRFYYDDKELDSFIVNINASNEALPQLLQQLFQNTILPVNIT